MHYDSLFYRPIVRIPDFYRDEKFDDDEGVPSVEVEIQESAELGPQLSDAKSEAEEYSDSDFQ